jgi:hypothetical protein
MFQAPLPITGFSCSIHPEPLRPGPSHWLLACRYCWRVLLSQTLRAVARRIVLPVEPFEGATLLTDGQRVAPRAECSTLTVPAPVEGPAFGTPCTVAAFAVGSMIKETAWALPGLTALAQVPLGRTRAVVVATEHLPVAWPPTGSVRLRPATSGHLEVLRPVLPQ